MLGPKEFRDVLRFLAMDEPPLLPGSTAGVTAPTAGSRKRKFVEVPADAGDVLTTDATPYKLDVEPSSVIEVPTTVEDPNQFAMTLPSNAPPVAHPDNGQNNVLSLFSPVKNVPTAVPNISVPMEPTTLGGFLTNGTPTAASSGMVPMPAPTTIPATNGDIPVSRGSGSTTATVTTTTPADANNQLAFLDEDLPLLPDSDHYNFSEGEQSVMKKLEDFETSLLDEYDVSCLDTLLQQLKNSNGDKPAGVTVADPEEVVVGPSDASPHNA